MFRVGFGGCEEVGAEGGGGSCKGEVGVAVEDEGDVGVGEIILFYCWRGEGAIKRLVGQRLALAPALAVVVILVALCQEGGGVMRCCHGRQSGHWRGKGSFRST